MWKFNVLTIIVVYLVSHFFMMVNNGWYIDDWCISTAEGITNIFTGVGLPFMIPFHKFLLGLTSYPALLYHFLTGILEIISLLIFYRCLTLLDINRQHKFLLTLFFAILPYNQAKITLVCFMYTVGCLLFLIGVLWFLKNRQTKNPFFRIISLLAFFGGFLFLPSTLIMELGFLVFYVFAKDMSAPRLGFSALRRMGSQIFRYADFIIVPFVFWVFKSVYLKPTGIYSQQNYRGFSFRSLILAPFNILTAFVKNLAGLAAEAGATMKVSNIMAAIFLAILLLVIVLFRQKRFDSAVNTRQYLLAGAFFFIAGAFPYVMVGLVPEFDGFETRHQILLRFGTAALLVGFISFLRNERIRKWSVITLTALFILSNISWQLQHQKSWFKQESMTRAFKNDPVIAAASNFSVIDNAVEYNEYPGPYVFYAYTGMMAKAFGNEDHFAVNDRDREVFFKLTDSVEIKNNALYHARGLRNPGQYDYYLFLDYGKQWLDNKENLKLLYKYYMNRAAFDSSVQKLIGMRLVPFQTK